MIPTAVAIAGRHVYERKCRCVRERMVVVCVCVWGGPVSHRELKGRGCEGKKRRTTPAMDDPLFSIVFSFGDGKDKLEYLRVLMYLLNRTEYIQEANTVQYCTGYSPHVFHKIIGLTH